MINRKLIPMIFDPRLGLSGAGVLDLNIVGGKFAKGDYFVAGFKSGSKYIAEFKKGDSYKAGFKKGETI